MIDTVTLRIKYPNFEITNPDLFSPRARFNENSSVTKEIQRKDVYKLFTQRNHPEDKKEGVYKPRIGVVQCMEKDGRKLEWFLSIQVSIPKMLFGNSIKEVNENMLEMSCHILQSKLKTMGIAVEIKSIQNAVIKKVHVAKNILIPPEYSISHTIELIRRANPKNLKDRQINYENGGEALHFYTSSHGTIFYDKLKDLEHNKNSSYDKDRMQDERQYGKVLKGSGLQVLRFEIRYNGEQTVTSKLRKYLHLKPDTIPFYLLFNQELWKEILIDEWEAIMKSNNAQVALKFSDEPKEVLKALLNTFKDQKKNVYVLTNILSYYGLFQLLQALGLNTTKSIFDDKLGYKTIKTRLDKKIEHLNTIVKNIPSSPAIYHLDKQIRECRQITDNDLE